MIRSLKSHLSLLGAYAIFIGILGSGNLFARAQTSVVSIPSIQIADGERIVGFEIHVRPGRIAALPTIPIGWNIQIDNDPSWDTSITGSVTVGAAALDCKFFKRFLVVEKSEPMGGHFDIQGEIIVTKDFVTSRRIKLEPSDFKLLPRARFSAQKQ